MAEFLALKQKTYSYLIDDGDKDKEAKDTKKCVTNRRHKYEYYKHCLEATQLENKINQLKKILKKKVDVDSFRENDKDLMKTLMLQ